MTDLALSWNDALLGADIRQAGQQLVTDDGLRTAIVISLFTDARAGADDELPDRTGDRRGWWGDDLAEMDGDLIGSKLWLLSRAKFTNAAIAAARDHARAALAWLVTDGVVRSLDIEAEGIRPSTLAIGVKLIRPDGTSGRFDFIWDATANALGEEAALANGYLPPSPPPLPAIPPAGFAWVVLEDGTPVVNSLGGRVYAPAP